MPKIIDYTGIKVGKLTFIKKVGKNKWGSNLWSYLCDCGKTGYISSQEIKVVEHHSCGCNSKHDNNPRVKNHILLKAHGGLLSRCFNPSNSQYHNYGGRGITVSDSWRFSFDNFYDDMVGTWKQGLELDRMDNNGNYCKENCRWVTHKINNQNKRTVKLTQEKADFIRSSKLSNYELAEMFSVHYETVRKIRKHKHTWV